MTIKGTEYHPIKARSLDGEGNGQGDGAMWDQCREQSVQIKRLEKKRDDQRLREEHVVREAQATLRANDEYLAMVSHDLSAPLNAMLGWAKILKSGKYSPDTLNHAIDIIERSAHLQQRLIENLRDSTRILEGKLRLEMRSVNLRQLLEAAVDLVQSAADEKTVKVEILLPADADPMLTCDPTRFQQIILNLLSNAIKVTPAGGIVTLQLKCLGQQYQLSVSDRGKGVARDRGMDGLGGNHSTRQISLRRTSSLGLGHVLARQLIELHGGTIHTESRVDGNGTVFSLHFPVTPALPAKEESHQKDNPMEATPLSMLNGLRILVVDDESDARCLMSVILGQHGADIIAVSSAREAMDVLTGDSVACPDLLISDISMPEEDGYDLIRHIRTLTPSQGGEILAIALTAFSRPSDRIAALKAGFHVHVTKPVETMELLDVIANLWAARGRAKPESIETERRK